MNYRGSRPSRGRGASRGSYDSYSKGGVGRGGRSMFDGYKPQSDYGPYSDDRSNEPPRPLLADPMSSGNFNHSFSSNYQSSIYDDYPPRPPRGGSFSSSRGGRPPYGESGQAEDILSSLDPGAKRALTQAIVDSVLKKGEYMGPGFDPRMGPRDFQDRNGRFASRGRGRGRGVPGRGAKRNNLSPEAKPSKTARKRPRSDQEWDHNDNDDSNRQQGFVELVCPFCPHMKSLRFKEYKFHLMSDEHNAIMCGTLRKHASVLHKIRERQRKEQKDEFAKWKETDSKGFDESEQKYCKYCKFNFKVKSDAVKEGIAKHNTSDLHQAQFFYLRPNCKVCDERFQDRVTYEHHKASVLHLKAKCHYMRSEENKDKDDPDKELDVDEFFRSLDGVDGTSKVKSGWKRNLTSDDDDLESVCNDKSLYGTEYVDAIDAFYCRLCDEIVRGDIAAGAKSAFSQHCQSDTHVMNYQDLHPEDIDDKNDSKPYGSDDAENGGYTR